MMSAGATGANSSWQHPLNPYKAWLNLQQDDFCLDISTTRIPKLTSWGVRGIFRAETPGGQ